MNRKTKIKVAIDIGMTAIFLLLMNLAWTGILLHELLGLIITAFFAFHLLVNRQWIATVARRFKVIESKKTKFMFVLNAALGAAMLMTVVSGILISAYLFPGLTDTSYDAWFVVHQISSWLSLGVVVLHTVIHWKWIANIVRQLANRRSAHGGGQRDQGGRIRVYSARALIGLFAIVGVYSVASGRLLDLLLPVSADEGTTVTASGEEATTSTSSAVIVSSDNTDTTTVTIQPTTTATTESSITLQQYLSNLHCTACHKHCLLSQPRCGRGVRQADSATTEYYDLLESGEL